MKANDANQSSKRTIAATLLYIEGAVVLALAVWLIVFSFTHSRTEILPLLGVVLFAIVGGLGLIACGRGFAAGRNYGRAPTVLANLIALGVAYYQIDGRFFIGAVPIILLALPTLYFALTIVPQ